jgi:hypothetical protein
MIRPNDVMVFLGLAAGAVLLPACTSNDMQPARDAEVPTLIPQAKIGPLVAEALCEVRERCGIGEYGSVQACVSATVIDAADDIDAEDCQDGALSTPLELCLAALRDESCSFDLDPGSLAACDEDVVCIQPAWGTSHDGAAHEDSDDNLDSYSSE